MPKGQPLVRTRTQQERMRRRLLLKGIPLLAIGVALAWSVHHFTSSKTEQDAPSSLHNSPLTATFTTPIMVDSDPVNHSQKESEPSSASPAIATLAPKIETEASPESDSPPTTALADAPNEQDAPPNSSMADNATATASTHNTNALPASNLESEERTNTENTASPQPNTATVAVVEPEVVTPKPINTSAPRVALPENFDSLSDSRLVRAHAPTTTYVSYQTLAQLTPNGNTPIRLAVNDISGNTERGRRGWIYAGRFSNGTWLERGLLIDNKLPTPGQSYQLRGGTKLRDNPPGRGLNNGNALGGEIGFLNSGKSIQVVQIRNSGNSGHIWLQVRH